VSLPKRSGKRVIKIGPIYANAADDEMLSELRAIAASRGGKCLSSDFLGSSTPLPFECSCGHRWQARPQDIKSGTWCRRCATKKRAEDNRLSMDMIHATAADRGGECLSDAYVDANTNLRWRCGKCGHVWEATPNAIRRGTWCPPCGVKAGWACRRKRFGKSGGNRGTLKYTIADMRKLASERGGRFLSPRFSGVVVPHRWECGTCGRKWMAAPSEVRQGSWCAVCSRRRRWERHYSARGRKPTR
jgi:hypothetical protein